MPNAAPTLAGLVAAGSIVAATAPAHAELIYGLLNNDSTSGQRLVTIDSATRAVTTTVLLQTSSNLATLSTIDVRPGTGQLYGFANATGQLYTVNPTTGALTTVGAPITSGTTSLTIDFNPAADAIRFVGTNGGNQNFSVNPTTGAIVATDTSLTYAAGDPNAGVTPNISATAYSNNLAGAATTTLYDVDVARDILAIQNPANGGVLSTVGSLGFDAGIINGFGTFDGFDISGQTGTAYLTDSAAGTPPFFGGPSATTTNFYTVNLSTGAATNQGTISGLPFGRSVQDIAVVTAVPEPASLGLLAATAAFAGLARRRRRA